MNICTIIAKNYVAHARVLVKSFRAHHPDGRCFVAIVDDFDGYIDPTAEPFEIVRSDEIGLDRETFLRMATIYGVLELSTAIKPSLLKMLMRRLGEPVLYLDPDIQIFSSIWEVARLAAEHQLVLTPHFTEPLPNDGRSPSELQILASGAYNLGFVALSPGPGTDKLVRWWARRLRYDCVINHVMGLFVDQRWFDAAPSLIDDVCILRDPGYNVAYWNLATRPITALGDGRYLANGVPLRFFHFSGYSPERPHLISSHQDRHSLAEEPVLRELFDGYRSALISEGFVEARAWPYTYAVMADGSACSPSLRGMFRRGELAGRLETSVFTESGVERFYDWLRQPADPGGAFGVNQFLAELHYARDDLRAAFPDLTRQEHAQGLVRWAHAYGDEVPIPEHLLPACGGAPEQAIAAGAVAAAIVPPAAPLGVNVAGYLRSELGVAEAARLAIRALDAADVPVIPIHGSHSPSSRQQHPFAHVTPDAAVFPINLICVNADRLAEFMSEVGPGFAAGRYQIGMWWWEVGTFPEEWGASFELVDEVWVGSRHVADALTPVAPIPVVPVPIPVCVPPPPPRSRAWLGLPEGFLFLFAFDFHSVLERKNPLGLIEAFKRAFPAGSGASLAIKCINVEHHADAYERLRVAAAGHPDIRLIDRYLSAADKNAMIASAECYVSLHRSEGFGLSLAEAMYLGKPVIATGYSGNLEFMHERNSYLVPYSMRPIGAGSSPYPENGEWAEPDLDEAARLMLKVMADPAAAQRCGARGAADIRKSHSAEAAGQVMRQRLEFIDQRLQIYPRAPKVPVVTALAGAADELIASGPARGGSALGRSGKRVIERLMRYRSIYQRAVDERLVVAIGSVAERTRRLEESAGSGRGLLGVSLARVMAELRRQDDALAALSPEAAQLQGELARISSHSQRVEDWLQKSDQLLAGAERIVREAHSRPNPAFLPFETFDNGASGRVYGYRPGTKRSSGYIGFEDIFRGDEDLVRQRQRVYLALIGEREPVLDAGCGRGEFLDLLRERGLLYAGVDLDEGMVARCREKGHLDVEQGDLNARLEGFDDGSLGAIFAAQVIEHLPLAELERFLTLATRKLAPEGILVAETVNPHSSQALKAFWLDLTHRHPIFPEVALALCSSAGFNSAFVFHPNASGDVDRDRFEAADYAVVATTRPPGERR